MKKGLIFLCLLIVVFSCAAMAQGITMTLGTVAAPAAGGTVSVPITVTNLSSVGSITLKIAYNPAVVTFTGVANAPTGVTFTSNAAGGVITLIWYDATGSTPLTIASGKLVDLNFIYISGSGTFTFNTSQCEVTTGTGTIINGVSYQNGSIGGGTSATITSFNPTSGSVGTAVTIKGTNFGSTQGTSTVKFGTTAATVTSWSDTSIAVTVPTLTAGGYTISVTTTTGTANSSTQFTVTASATTTISISNVTAPAAGGTVSVPITVTNLSSVGSITLKIAYNPAVVTFTGVANAPTGVTFTSNAAGGVITLIWYDATGSTPLTIASGKLVDLNFTYISGSGTFTFNTSQCEVTTGTGTIITGVSYQNGSIGGGTSATITSFNPTSGSVGTAVTIKGTNFGSTQGTSTVKFGTTAATVTSWSDTSIAVTVPTLTAGGYTISVTTASGTANSATQFTVTASAAPTITISNVTAPAAGGTVSVPITVTNLSSVGSITLKIAYNPAVVTFTGVANAPTGVTFTSNAAGGVITLIWYDATGSTPLTIASGKLVDLNFTYISGSGTFTFNTSQCEVTTGTGTIISGVSYQNGTITSSTATTFTLGAVAAPAAGGTVSVPITVANLTSVGSITLKIAYNPAVVTFTGVANAPTGVNFTSNASGGVISLIWYDATGSTPLTIASGKLIDLNFTYISGTGSFTFNTSQCEVTTGTGTIITGVAYFDGSIGLVQNQKPTFTPIPAITKAELDTVKFVVSATDPNVTDVLTYSASGLPTGATFTATTRTFFWVPTLGQNGTYTVKFRVSDGQLTDSTNAVITITKTNMKPTLTAIPAITKAERDTVKFVVSATDPNPGDVLTYSASGLPTGATFTAATQTFLWVPSLGQNGSYTVKIFVTDGQLKDSTNVVITITKTNLKPTFNAIAAITKAELDTVKFVVSATDPNPGDVLTYSASGLPTGATFTAATQTFLWVPSLGQNGSYAPLFVVSDGQLKDSMKVIITITKLKMIVKNPIADMTLDDNPIAHRTVKIKLTSPPVFANNIGVLTYTSTSANTAIVSATILTPDTLQIKGLKAGGPVLVTVTAKDVDNSQITDSINVTVTGATGVDEAGIIPTEFSLSQNYPNPFNPSTMIKFGLPVQAHVTMEVYNILGVKVRTLLRGEVMSAGIHQLEWNGKDNAGASVTSGVYLYRINAGTFQVTKKMMLLK